jgi:hypothetical protein
MQYAARLYLDLQIFSLIILVGGFLLLHVVAQTPYYAVHNVNGLADLIQRHKDGFGIG